MEQPRDAAGTQAEGTPHDEQHPVAVERSGASEQTGTAGVSDKRRAELQRMEADAGMAHEAADESVPQRTEPVRTSYDQSQAPASGRQPSPEGLRQTTVNPDIDKR